VALDLPPRDENGLIYEEVPGGYSIVEEKKMQRIQIMGFRVDNATVYIASSGEICADVLQGKCKIFDKDQEPLSAPYRGRLDHYFIGEDFDGADLMEFDGMDYVRTVKRVVRKSHLEMFREMLEMLAGCLVISNPGGDSFVCYKNECILLGCGTVFECLRPYLSIKLDKPQKYGIIERQSLYIYTKDIERLIKENENKFLKVYDRLKGM
jgi:hypothetical protein